MNIKYVLLIICFSLLCSQVCLQGQETQANQEITSLMFKASTINSSLLWDRAITSTQTSYELSNSSADLLQLCYAYYGKLGNCLSTQNKDEGLIAVEKGLAAAEKLSQDADYESVANALLAGYNGMTIAFSPMKGMFLGPKSDKQVKKSLDLNPNNAIGWLQKGSSQFNTPKIFGGSVKKSIKSFKKSVECFDKDESMPIWMKLESMIWLGQAYYETKDYQSAHDTYMSVLEIAPGHQWVEAALLPATLKKLN